MCICFTIVVTYYMCKCIIEVPYGEAPPTNGVAKLPTIDCVESIEIILRKIYHLNVN